MFADAIRQQAEVAPRAALPAVAAALWRAFADGQISEAEAEALSELIEARRTKSTPDPASAAGTVPDRPGSGRRSSVGSKPRTSKSLERRRRLAASGRLPPRLAARFTLAEQAVLALVAAETAKRGDCRLTVGHLAALAGVSETTVRNAVREARQSGLLTVEERRVTGLRNLPNIVRITSPEWTAWLRLKRKDTPRAQTTAAKPSPAAGGGCKSPKRTNTQFLDPPETDIGNVKKLPRKGMRA